MTRTAPDPEPPVGVAADSGTLRALEFATVVDQLTALAAFTPSRELAAASLPMADPVLVAILQDQTDEATRLLDEQAQAGIGGARDVRQVLERASRGGRLTPADLLDLAETLRATGLFAARLSGWKGSHLAGVRAELDDAPPLRQRIERSIDEAGEILDSASGELAAIRRRLRTAQDRVRERLNTMLRSSVLAGVIGEAIVTLRAGRYVIPIRAEAKGKLKGIVHDQSASGATLFIEPLSVVELNNTWTQAMLDAEREEERILEELSRAGRRPRLRRCRTRSPLLPERTSGWLGRAGGGRWMACARSSAMMPPSSSRPGIRCWVHRPSRSTCASESASAIAR